ncbi:phosphoribosyl-AMP cyclohydrolase [Zymomonas mobilis]|uniref:Phosphoribosyl-AMP cyclohydrolase n=1 Tax=Zymomonas mobilis subsp. pomaceae (strain ATCC 29192 / DSM 22645 / JCM 10191 / CCUG 17912 / NBRC 13757 / NCIMB 11200 / NRRL B-4491 / Barker I) TaxID=579138 RepID=F8ETL8_ZYMMT|nr:phosphoribosyl-AMP cyclohydrolase [Zymomonas mobilis]AEI37028.1 Phosphoribosyl-AMP cyclohydrolase [Zymomonas mobilis subsp. pomaceae ATCC 29192]MDX5948400.1 phosphoribosyl-AMP cyclohydrolase [Zymomonas mobilis subsp. pomaceae]GEB89610.1 phosphoribosyl-AMP cyclohydrolase [Zymomonas mobilis subsp. pomaceae]
MQPTRDSGYTLDPCWDEKGLITAILTDATSGLLLMVAHMNKEAFERSIATQEAHFWSRSRQKLWRKGEESGHVMKIQEIRIDCDQDALWLKVIPMGPACHTGAKSCFYRRIEHEHLVPVPEDKI